MTQHRHRPAVAGHTPSPRVLAHAIHGALLAMACAAGAAQAQQPAGSVAPAAQAAQDWNIGAGPLDEALARVAAQGGVSLIAPPALTDGRSTRGLRGRHGVAEALARLLAGTGLQAVPGAAGAYVLRAAPQAAPGPVPTAGAALATTLAPVLVTAVADRDLRSEGSGAYGARAASTATKLDLPLRHTPQSVTVVTRQQMEDTGAQTLTDVMSQVTGIVVTANDTERVNYMSRGYGISTYQIDGVNTSYSNGYVKLVSDPAIYDRIEILRGAAGQTVGAGDPGGTINQVRKRPTDRFAGSVGLTLGRWNNRRAEVDLGGPLAFDGKLRGRMVAVRQKSDSFRDWYTSDKQVFYGILEADLGENTTLSLGYDNQRPENSGVTWGTIPYWLSDGSLANMPRAFNPAARWSQWAVREKQAFLRLDHRFNDDWRARVTYTDDDQTVYGARWYGGAGYFPNPDGTGKAAWYGGGDNFATARTWDLDLSGKFELLGRTHRLNVGYHRERFNNRTPASTDSMPDGFFTAIPDWRHWDGIVPEYTRTYHGYDSSYTIGRQSAFYFSTELQLADPLRVLVGARRGDWSQYAYTRSDSTGAYGRTGYAIDKVWTPYAAVMLDLNRHFTVYGSYTDIFTPQNRRDVNGDYIDPVNGKHHELGLKGEFFEGALNTSFAVFRSLKDNVAEIDDGGQLAAGSFDPNNPPAGYNNAGYRYIPGTQELPYRSTGKGNRVRGFEFEVQGAVTRDWNIAAGFTRAVTRNATGALANTHLPQNTVRLRTNYRLPGAWSRLRVGAGLNWQSKAWSDVSGVPTGQVDASGRSITETRRITQQDYFLVDLSAHYEVSKQLSVSLNVNNVFDKSYYQRVGFYSGVMYGTPRDWRLNMRYTF